MNIGRIWRAFPWRTTLILTAALCLSTLSIWAWFTWELPPLQRHYLGAYWHSSRTADDPQAVTEVRWLDLTAPGRKDAWPLDADVADDPFDDSQVALSYQALAKGWTEIRISAPDLVSSIKLERFLRRSIYDGRDLRQLLIEPASYACFAVLLVLFVAWRMRDGIRTEWSDLWRVVREPESVWESGWDIPPYKQPIRARIRNRIAGSLATLTSKRKRFPLEGLTTHRSARHSEVDSQPATNLTRPSFSAGDPTRLMMPSTSTSDPTAQTKTELIGHLVFPGSSPSYVASKDANAWHESEWIE
jgi:hypothetical protein